MDNNRNNLQKMGNQVKLLLILIVVCLLNTPLTTDKMEIVILALLWWAVEMTNPKNNNQ